MPLSRPTLILETPRASGERGHRFYLARLESAEELDAAECLAEAARHLEGGTYLAVSRLVSQVLRGQNRKDAPETLVAGGLPVLSTAQRAALRAHLDRCLAIWDQRHAVESGVEKGLRVASPLIESWENEMYQLLGLQATARTSLPQKKPSGGGCRKLLLAVLVMVLLLAGFLGWQLWRKVQSFFAESPSAFTSTEETTAQKLGLDRGWRELAARTGLQNNTPQEVARWEQAIAPYLLKLDKEDAAFIKALNGDNTQLDATLDRWQRAAASDSARQPLINFREFATLAGCATHEEALGLIRHWEASLIDYSKKDNGEGVRKSIAPVLAALNSLPKAVSEWTVVTPADLRRWRLISEWLATDAAFHARVDGWLTSKTWGPTMGQNEIRNLRDIASKGSEYSAGTLCMQLTSVLKEPQGGL